MSDYTGVNGSVDYTFMKEMVDNLTTRIFEPAQDPDELVMDVITGSGTSRTNAAGEINPNVFMKQNGNQGQFANTQEQKEHVHQNIDEINRRIDDLKKNPSISDKPAIQQYYGFQQNLMNNAKNGIDVWRYMTRIPGGERSLTHADFKETSVVYPENPEKGAEEYNQMFQEMGYTKAWDNLEKRIQIEHEMDGKLLSADQKKKYAQDIQKSNTEMITTYEGMMRPENEKKFGHLYQNFGGANGGTVSGSRGYQSTVRQLHDENAALANGWDVTKLADYHLMKSFSANCDQADAMFEDFADPALGNYAKMTKKVAVLNPEGKKFSSQEDFDRYMTEYQHAMEDMRAEANKPEVQQAIKSGLEAYNNKVNADPSLDRQAKDKKKIAMEDMLPAALSTGRTNAVTQAAYLNKTTDLAARKLTGNPAEVEAYEKQIQNIKQSVKSQREKETKNSSKTADYFKENPGAGGRPGPNENGKEYVWDAMGGRVNLGKMVNKVSVESDEFWYIAREDRNAHQDSLQRNYKAFHKVDEIIEDIDDTISDEGIEGAEAKGTYVQVGGDKFSTFVAEGHEKDAQNYIKESADAMRDGANLIRGMKSDDPDPQVAQTIDRSANRLAKWTEDYANILSDEKGSLALGEGRSATLTQTLVKGGSLPILTSSRDRKNYKTQSEAIEYVHKTMDKSIRIMHQLDKPEDQRVSIFDDYMDIMDGANTELKVEYHRQHMEESGWDANKDEIYKTELKASHEKIINAFDRLCKVPNEDEYRQALNNDLSEMTGNRMGRDLSAKVGYMKGENQAIDMGYPSDQMFALGEVGAIEGMITRAIRRQDQNLIDIPNRKGIKPAEIAEEQAKVEQEKKRLDGVLKEFTEIKNEVWGKEYSSPEATLEIYHKQNEFLDRNPEFNHRQAGESFREARELNSLADKTTNMRDLSDAMSDFNAKRTDKWFSSESKPHKNLRESAEALRQELRAYQTGIYQTGEKKGQRMPEVDRVALREGIEKRADEVSQNADTYLGKRKGDRSTEAGNQRKTGAEKLKNMASAIKQSMEMDRQKEALAAEKEEMKAGVDKGFGEEISDAMELAESERVRRNEEEIRRDKKAGKQTGRSRGKTNMDRLYEKLQGEAEVTIHESAIAEGGLSDKFTHYTACMIVGTAMQIEDKRNGRPLSDRDPTTMAGRLEKDPAFKEMMKGVVGNEKKQQELASMEPGEIYAKYAMVRQNMKVREAKAGNREKAVSLNAAQMNAAQQQQVKQGPKK